MACSTPCCLYGILMEPWNVCMRDVYMYECTYVCVCVCMYVGYVLRMYVYMYVFMCHILRAEGFFGTATILSLVREVNSCSSIYILVFSALIINLQYHTANVIIFCAHRYIKYYIRTVFKYIIRNTSVFISGNGLIMDPEMR